MTDLSPEQIAEGLRLARVVSSREGRYSLDDIHLIADFCLALDAEVKRLRAKLAKHERKDG